MQMAKTSQENVEGKIGEFILLDYKTAYYRELQKYWVKENQRPMKQSKNRPSHTGILDLWQKWH